MGEVIEGVAALALFAGLVRHVVGDLRRAVDRAVEVPSQLDLEAAVRRHGGDVPRRVR